MASKTITQVKGDVSFVWGASQAFNLSKDAAISYEIGANGDTLGALKDVVHVLEDSGSIVSKVTVTFPKGAPEIAEIDALLLTRIPYPLLVRDSGIGYTVAMTSAICSQVALSDTTGGSDMETTSYTFSGNLFKAEL